MSPLIQVLTGLVKPIGDVIDNLHTSTEEKLKARAALVEMQVSAAQQILDYEARLLDAKASIVRAEAQGRGWMQRSWRPITMLTFLALVCADSFGLLAFRLAPEAWDLLKIGLGGYVIGRSAEKITPAIAEAIKDKAK